MRAPITIASPMPELELRPSRILIALLAAAHLFSLALLWLMPLTPVWRLAASLAVLASGAYYLRRDGLLRAPGSILCIRIEQDLTCSCRTPEGWRTGMEILGSSMVTPWLSVLRLKSGHARSLTILPDAVNAEEYRKLRVFLRHRYAARLARITRM